MRILDDEFVFLLLIDGYNTIQSADLSDKFLRWTSFHLQCQKILLFDTATSHHQAGLLLYQTIGEQQHGVAQTFKFLQIV